MTEDYEPSPAGRSNPNYERRVDEIPEEGDLVRVTFDDINRGAGPVQGEVTEAHGDGTGGYGVEVYVRLDEAGTANQVITYAEGRDEDGRFATVTRSSPFGGKPTRIGENAELEVL